VQVQLKTKKDCLSCTGYFSHGPQVQVPVKSFQSSGAPVSSS